MNQTFHRFGIQLLAVCWVVCICNQVAGPCRAQESTKLHQHALPNAESILDRHIEATGGKQAQLAVKTTAMTGTLSNDLGGHTFTADITVTSAAPNKQHIAIHHSQFNLVRATNGIEAWEWSAGGNTHQHEDEAVHQDPGQTKWLDKLDSAVMIERAVFNSGLTWRERFKSVETIGLADVNDQPAIEVQVTPFDGEPFSQFYDKASGRHVKTIRTVESSSMGKYKMESVFDQYQEFDGVWLVTRATHTLHTDLFGVGTQSYDYSDVKINCDVPDSLFKVPSELESSRESQK